MFSKKAKQVKVIRSSAATSATVTRKDISCGFVGCTVCTGETHQTPTLDSEKNLLVVDANVILHNMNALEDSRTQNIVLLSTVMQEVQNRNKGVYARLQRLLDISEKHVYVFANDRHEQTHCVKAKEETINDFNDRCIRVAAIWYARHVQVSFQANSKDVYLLSHDKHLRSVLAENEEAKSLTNLKCMTLRDFIAETMSGETDLLEKTQYINPEGMKETSSTGALFTPHLSPSAIEAGLQNGSFLKGKLRVSDASCFFGEIRGKFEGHSFDRVLIPGRTNLNRALHDDVVAVELLSPSEWRGPAGTEGKETEEEALKCGFVPVGHVVGIITMRRRPYCGSLDADDLKKLSGSSLSGNISILFQPKDNRIPRIRLSTTQVEDLKNKRIMVVVDDWSVHSSFPVGHYVEIIGEIGDKDTEATVILLENDIPHYDFSEAVYNCLPKGEWKVSEEEVQKRLDLRGMCVVSVDPLGCRDIDDALHCRVINGNHLEVGVHIADVTHFLLENTPMDDEAAKRCTSVYLVDRRINMLPQLLTENLCSLVEGEDRYAFSILFEFDESLEVVNSLFTKSIIRSRGALYYGDAQRMHDDPSDNSEIAVSLRHLMRLSKHFKSKREKDGALFLASQEFKFKVDNAHVNPTDMQVYQTFEANSMIEEWMLYANAAAARKVYESFPRWALLRRHQRPGEGAFDKLNEALEKKLGLQLDDTSSLHLNQSLNKCVDPNDPYFNTLIRILTTRCLRQAEYFCTNDVPKEEFNHFGLAMPIYTHFTSPIRRYADVVVHRQLAAAIGLTGVSEMLMDVAGIESIADNINYRHQQAQRAGRDSQNLFTGFYLRNFENGVIPDEDGYVVRHSETDVFVLVPKYGQESKIPKSELSTVPELLEKVKVEIKFVKQGDIMRTKLLFSLKGLMKTGAEGGMIEVEEELNDMETPEKRAKLEENPPSS